MLSLLTTAALGLLHGAALAPRTQQPVMSAGVPPRLREWGCDTTLWNQLRQKRSLTRLAERGDEVAARKRIQRLREIVAVQPAELNADEARNENLLSKQLYESKTARALYAKKMRTIQVADVATEIKAELAKQALLEAELQEMELYDALADALDSPGLGTPVDADSGFPFDGSKFAAPEGFEWGETF